MKLRHVFAFERNFDITVERVNQKLKITITDGKKTVFNKVIKDGDTVTINL
ncbi:hypothetical protein D3C85_1943880 [compost metagenome]